MPSPNLNIHQSLALSQQLKLVLNPRMLQLLKTLHLPYTDLIESINKEVAENPALEISKQDELLSFARTLSKQRKETPLADYDEKPDRELKARGPSLEEHLLAQLRLEDVPETDLAIAEFLIGNIDDRGYLENYTELREEIMQKQQVAKGNVDKVLGIIQTLEPEGVGARSLKECLLIQVQEYSFDNPELQQVIFDAIKYHLDDIAAKEYAAIAEDLELDAEGVTYIANFIEKNLNPAPGHVFKTDTPSEIIIPSFQIKEEPVEITGIGPTTRFAAVNLEHTKGPQLMISNNYLKMLEDPATDEQTKEFLKQKVATAKIFIENIQRRHQTIDKIMNIIIDTQQEFFHDGYYWLKPLQQSVLANLVGVHPSTISRAVSTKYAETPQGLYPLKYLCPRNFQGYSPMQIKGLLKKIFKEKATLSDQKTADLLKEIRTINIKRRTITKYRAELGEASSYKRK